MTSRLSSVAPDLSDRIGGQPASVQRSLAVKASRWALASVELSDPRVDAAFQAFDEGQVGPTGTALDLEILVDELDEVPFDLQEAGDEDGYSAAFDRPRAAGSLQRQGAAVRELTASHSSRRQ